MVRYLLLIVIVFFLNAETFPSEILAKFKCKVNERDAYISASFYKNNEYELVLTDFISNDMIFATTISCGHYRRENNRLILNDVNHNYKMIFTYTKEFIIANRSFIPIEGMRLTYCGKISGRFDLKSKILKIKALDINSEKGLQRDLPMGQYIFNHQDIQIHNLTLTAPNIYNYKINNISLLSGTFRIVKNQLILDDSALKHSFVFQVDSTKIIENFLVPGFSLEYKK